MAKGQSSAVHWTMVSVARSSTVLEPGTREAPRWPTAGCGRLLVGLWEIGIRRHGVSGRRCQPETGRGCGMWVLEGREKSLFMHMSCLRLGLGRCLCGSRTGVEREVKAAQEASNSCGCVGGCNDEPHCRWLSLCRSACRPDIHPGTLQVLARNRSRSITRSSGLPVVIPHALIAQSRFGDLEIGRMLFRHSQPKNEHTDLASIPL